MVPLLSPDQWQSQEFIFEGPYLEPKSVLFSELHSLLLFLFFEEWVNSPKLAHEPKFIKLNYYLLNKITEIYQISMHKKYIINNH